MFQYILKRIFFFIPTLILISMGAFLLSKLAPGDPVEMVMKGESSSSSNGLADYLDAGSLYRQVAEKLGLNKPWFYFSVSSRAYPDTLYIYVDIEKRATLKKLIAQYGNWEEISNYYRDIDKTLIKSLQLPDTLDKRKRTSIQNHIKQLFFAYKDSKIGFLLNKLEEDISANSDISKWLTKDFNNLKNSYFDIKKNQNRGQLYIPDIKWYGLNNQYHSWISSFFTGDFGISYSDGRPVGRKIYSALFWTLLLNLISIILAFAIAIPIGVFTAVKKGTGAERRTSLFLFILYSLPVFWIATLLLVFFTTPEYGMEIFEGVGLGNISSDMPFIQRFFKTGAHLILPVFSLTYGALAYISRQMQGGMLKVLQQDYIKTARAKGLNEKTVIWKHAFRNSLFPIITLFAMVFPAVIAGSVVVEVIFNIPGMGRLTFDAIISRDWPVVYTVLMFGAILTMIGVLVADILYASVDPRVRFGD